MTDDYQVAIPSYQRPGRVVDRTLTALINGGVDPAHVTIFAHDNDPTLDAYSDVARAVGVSLQATPARGIIEQRATIANHYPADTNVATFDDDVIGLETLTEDGKKLQPVRDLDAFLRHMFTTTRAERLTAWGLAPVRNAFFMNDKISTDLKFLIYTCAGYITSPEHPAQTNTVATKDDYEHSIRRWWWDGGVVRHNGVVANAAVYTGAGGLSGAPEREAGPTERAVQSLEAQWPGVVRRNTKRKGPLPEILLNRKPRHDGHDWTTPPPGLAP